MSDFYILEHGGHGENTAGTAKFLFFKRFFLLAEPRNKMIFVNMSDDEVITIILDEAFYVFKKIGPGMLESVYKTCLAHRLVSRGLKVQTEKPIPVIFEGIKMDCGYRADLIVEDRIIIEIKNIDSFADIHTAQILTYLRFLDLRWGLILNFKTVLFKNGIKRVVNGFEKR